jgi:membrane protease YdiL (CAAX protease family)
MSEELITTQEALAAEALSEIPAGDKRYRWFELSLVLLISFGNSFLGGLDLMRSAPNSSLAFRDSRWVIQTVQELSCLLLLGYVLSRRRLRFRDLGLRWSLGDIATGLAVAVASYLSYTLGYLLVHSLLRALHASVSTGMTARGAFGHPSFAAIPVFLLNPFFEELIVRAYLMTESKT